MELQHRLELTKLEAESEVVAASDQAELAKLEAFLAEQEMSELTNEEEGIKWSPKVEEFHPKDKLVEPLEVPVASSSLVICSRFTPASASVLNPPLTSTPAVENAAATTSTHASRGICFSDPLMAPKFKPTVHESNVPKPIKGDCQKESNSEPLTFVTSISTLSTVTPNVSSATVNESLVAIMSSMERISASYDLPRVRVQKFDGSPQQYHAFRQRFEQLVETKPLDDPVKMIRL